MDASLFGWWFTLLGLPLLALAFWDVLHTTLHLDGGGPLTRLFSDGAWKVLLAGRRRGWTSHEAISRFSPFLLAWLLLVWNGLVWVGWTLVFCSDSHAVVDTFAHHPATPLDRLYFVGNTILTLGLGDFRPNGFPWELLTVAAGGSGYFLMTLSVAYLLPVYSAAIQKRQTASYVSSLGTTPEELVEAYRDGLLLKGHLRELHRQVLMLSEKHRAYPVLHFFHGSNPDLSLALRMATLDEGLSLLQFGLAEDVSRLPIKPLRQSISRYLDTLEEAHMEPSKQPPSSRDLSRLRDLGFETVSQAEYDERLTELAMHRRCLLGLVVCHGWEWSQI
ncbi:MAG: potassium channel family protein [Vulcanimicrobiota bacterium]